MFLLPKESLNSTMVRLKPNRTQTRRIILMSQFHYGSIKTPNLGQFVKESETWSQFHYGSIKTLLKKPIYPLKSFSSQFHYGSIKTKHF
ncbi:Hypothetical protein IALB_1215 [Ignavibacterium album JCM 16511]|uniref:Uncharacterized protein n=1 Tax=Ignavibacterium album (strain DSM 19864 / JCM 16511 / NBRC 101810 / Mat9-16) TaxID=945713 RepID=I0AIW9_IGNAJ|nr:Hypothetical protein IALB_1215 [Ignavibacterium album JCM 16511]